MGFQEHRKAACTMQLTFQTMYENHPPKEKSQPKSFVSFKKSVKSAKASDS